MAHSPERPVRHSIATIKPLVEKEDTMPSGSFHPPEQAIRTGFQ
jgi:hypothetical protein